MHNNRYLLLISSLVLMIFASPYLSNSYHGQVLISFLILFVLITIVFTTLQNRTWFFISCVLAIMILILHVLKITMNLPWNTLAFHVSLTYFYLFAITTVFIELYSVKHIGREMVFAGLSVYLLIGVAYANVFQVIDLLFPGSFIYDNGAVITNQLSHFDLTYFSFTTLTTTGFGDILPITTYAKSIVMIEQITGVFYLAAIVARLVAVTTKK